MGVVVRVSTLLAFGLTPTGEMVRPRKLASSVALMVAFEGGSLWRCVPASAGRGVLRIEFVGGEAGVEDDDVVEVDGDAVEASFDGFVGDLDQPLQNSAAPGGHNQPLEKTRWTRKFL